MLYLSGHDPLSFLNKVTLGTLAVSILACSLVALEPRDEAMVPTASTLGSPQRILSGVHCGNCDNPCKTDCLSSPIHKISCWGIDAAVGGGLLVCRG